MSIIYEESKQKNKANNSGFFAILIGVIIHPCKTMALLVEKPQIAFGFVATLFGTFVFYLLRFPLFKEYMRVKTINQGKQTTLSENALNRVVIQELIATPISSVVWWFIIVLLLFGVVKLLKGEVRFKQLLSVTGYAYVPVLISYVIFLFASFFTGRLLLDTSLARVVLLFSPELKGTFVYGFLKSIDIFGIWYFALIGLGTVYASKLSKKKVFTIVGAIYLICALLAAGTLMYS